MSESGSTGVLYTEYGDPAVTACGISSQWSFESCDRILGRPKVRGVPGVGTEYWLERPDPLLNTILPGTGVSLIINWGDLWAAGPSLLSASFLPRISVSGAVTKRKVLVLGKQIQASGVGFPAALAMKFLGVPAAELADRIVPLEDLWPRHEVARLADRRSVKSAREYLIAHGDRRKTADVFAWKATEAIRGGNAGITELAGDFGLSRHQFARRFLAATGLSPKRFSRICRFEVLLPALLATDVGAWASLAPAMGFYDQAHMIHEFRDFAGAPPTMFFSPDGLSTSTRLQGKPSEWW
ncbi:MAG: AraC family transcriptional regulator [Bryobacteraceae bacterium]|nr:AraC family transcriptional regulator [Bryobacteraceae bacterium]